MIFLIFSMGLTVFMVIHQIKRGQRQQFAARLADQLTEALETIVSALKAGSSFVNALTLVANEMQQPLKSEFELVLLDYRIGRPLDEGLEKLAARQPTEDFQCLLAAVKIAQSSGGSLASVLGGLAQNLREKKNLLQQANAMAAQGKLQAYVMSFLPLFLFVVIRWLDPALMGAFMTEGWGKRMVGIIFLAQALAFFMMQKILEIEV